MLHTLRTAIRANNCGSTMGVHLSASCLLLLTWLCSMPSPTHAQTLRPPTRPRTTNAFTVDSARVSHFGVMGAVARPGVYAEDTATPLLVDVVARAGGLTDQATGNVRIVRGERAGQQTFYTPGLDFRLQRGDLVVVDTRPGARSRHRSGTAGATPRAENDGIQLAFLHVLDRPVVLKMRSTDASIARILTLLGQSGELASSIRVVETGPAYTRGHRDETTRLADGSVLVFDEDRIDRRQLPSFPPVFGKSTPNVPTTIPRAADVAPAIIPDSTGATTRPERQRPEPRPLVDGPVDAISTSRPARSGIPSTTASMTRRSATMPPARDPLLPPVPRPRTVDDSADVAERPIFAGPRLAPGRNSKPTSIPMRTAAAPAALPPTPPPVSDAVPNPGDAEVPPPAFLDETPTAIAAEAGREDEDAAITESTANERAEGDPGTADTGSLVIVLTVLVVAAGLIWLLGRRTENVGSIQLEETTAEVDADPIESESTGPTSRRRIDTGHASSRVPAAHAPLAPPSSLDDLIEGRVTFQEEPLSLPNSLELFGRSTTEVWHRVDEVEATTASTESGSESIPRPRRPRRPHIAEKLARSVAASESETAEVEHGPAAKVPKSGLVLDRVLTAVHGARQR